ncbi:hypothetical protein N7533_012272 [Penicillium manginii]|uniref:uncharacterized protein n=1 Tax=Penicillium manginii TaxID=203109 RepID=UPI002548126C|nr:uncharacterized protein N7533_012272 [Penicillium manginii]KAJ5739488.1 hypothetical protein N7533_012272 [Penicillium manginii]
MPSFSPSIPGLISGDSSSISSFGTNTTSSEAAGSARDRDRDDHEFGGPVGRETQARRQNQNQNQRQQHRQRQSIDRERLVTVTSNISAPAGSRGTSTRAARSATSGSHTSSSWSITAPSISSAGLSVPAHIGDADINGEEGNGLGLGLGHAADADAPDRIYTCLFHMLDCHESFSSENNWTTHVLSHFRTHPPPQTARCPLCPNKFVDGHPHPLSSPAPGPDEEDAEPEDVGNDANLKTPPPSSPRTSIRRVDSGTDVRPDGPYTRIDHEITGSLTTRESAGTAWPDLLTHVAAHYRAGQTLAGSRADFELMRYLYGRRIISDAQFKAMQLAPAPSSPAYHASQDGVRASIGSSDEPYCAPYSRRREERLRGQHKGVGAV